MTRTADRAAFLAAILARPGDDLPRLIYADWLDEHGEPERAEFIRVQCELAHPDYEHCLSDSHCVCCRRPAKHEALRGRQRELLGKTGFPPALPFAFTLHHTPSPGGRYLPLREGEAAAEWTRGFISRITCDWPAWRDHAAAIRAATPLERVTFTTWPGQAWRWTGTQPPTDIWVIPGDGVEEAEGVLGYERERAISAMLARRYSGIAFELPRPE